MVATIYVAYSIIFFRVDFSNLLKGEIMRCLVLDRYTVQKTDRLAQINEPFILISIVSPGASSYPVPIHSCLKGALVLVFSDVDPNSQSNGILEQDYSSLGRNGTTLFNSRMAKDILDFVAIHIEESKTVVVHCEAGISRSPAVAMGIAEFFCPYENIETIIDGIHGTVRFNRFVYRKMRSVMSEMHRIHIVERPVNDYDN